ncbi:MAG: flavin reductase family protein [Synergistaceae bacterium]|jgi:flavin reductase (DIM6/NTAB) family NADH-FMN oxidoreductase RutF|nr:flavin reductase family protein [Synergistaceae bacterium]
MFEGKRDVGAVASVFPTPIALCGTYDSAGKANLATLAWAGVCCSEPPSVQISVRPSRHTHAAIIERREFTVSIPASSQADIADYCGMASGKNVDKLAAAGLDSIRGKFVNAPVVRQFPICMECRLTHRLEVGSHDLFVGEVLASWIDEKYLDDLGVSDLLSLSPIAYAQLPGGGCYYAIGQSAGKSFSIGKTLLDKR